MDPQNPAGAPVSAATSEVNDFMDAMGGMSAPPQAPDAPDTSQPPVVEQQVPSQETVTETYTDIQADQSQLEQPVSAVEQPVPPANNSQAELDRYRQEAELARQAAQSYKAQVDQYNAAMQAEMVRAQARQADQMRAERINQAMQVHEQLVDSGQPEKAADYIRSFYDNMLLQDRQQSQAQMANLQVQQQQREHQLLAPRYAEELVRANNLPQEYVSVLSQFDGYTQDRMVAGLKAQHEAQQQRLTQRETEMEQRIRELEAAQRAASGAFNPGGTNGAAAAGTGPRPSDPRQAEVWDYMQSPIIQR